jgi:hypothetical protein
MTAKANAGRQRLFRRLRRAGCARGHVATFVPFFAPHGPVADGSELERCELGWRCLVKECAEDQTMTEFDPNDPLRRAEMRDVRDEGNLATIGLLAVLAIAVMGGIYLWTTGDRTNTAMNTAPGVTTGASKTTPPAAPAPPAKDQGATR